MIVLSNSQSQTIQPNQTVIFDTVVMHTGKAECYRPNTGSIKMCCNGIYELHFSGNITNETGTEAVQLQLATDSVPLNETRMVVTPSAAEAYNSIGTETLYKNCCCDFDRVSVVNTGTVPVVLDAGSSFFVKRVA